MAVLTCTCEKNFEFDIPESVDLSLRPEATEEILSGTFFTLTCPHCGEIIKPEFPLKITDQEKKIDIFLVPEMERDRYLAGLTHYPESARVVIGFAELAEKLRILSDELDDRAVEILKYYLLLKAANQDLRIYYKETDGDDLVFEIIGLRDGEVGNARIPEALYNTSKHELEHKLGEEPFSLFLEPPYVSVNKIELEIDGD